jgi:hypothetical protein
MTTAGAAVGCAQRDRHSHPSRPSPWEPGKTIRSAANEQASNPFRCIVSKGAAAANAVAAISMGTRAGQDCSIRMLCHSENGLEQCRGVRHTRCPAREDHYGGGSEAGLLADGLGGTRTSPLRPRPRRQHYLSRNCPSKAGQIPDQCRLPDTTWQPTTVTQFMLRCVSAARPLRVSIRIRTRPASRPASDLVEDIL